MPVGLKPIMPLSKKNITNKKKKKSFWYDDQST